MIDPLFWSDVDSRWSTENDRAKINPEVFRESEKSKRASEEFMKFELD